MRENHAPHFLLQQLEALLCNKYYSVFLKSNGAEHSGCRDGLSFPEKP